MIASLLAMLQHAQDVVVKVVLISEERWLVVVEAADQIDTMRRALAEPEAAVLDPPHPSAPVQRVGPDDSKGWATFEPFQIKMEASNLVWRLLFVASDLQGAIIGYVPTEKFLCDTRAIKRRGARSSKRPAPAPEVSSSALVHTQWEKCVPTCHVSQFCMRSRLGTWACHLSD